MIENYQVTEYSMAIRKRIYEALKDDQGSLGDVTSLALIDKEKIASAELVVKDEFGIISGIEVARAVYRLVDPTIKFTPLLQDGDYTKKGDIFATVEGNARNLLTAERTALEFLRRMSGIATKTRLFVNEVEGTGTRILDTRKIMPGYGELDKQAVRDGGGQNHRVNLSEMGLIKNNHIDVLDGNIALAIQLFKEKYPQIPLEVEVRNIEEFLSALACNPDRILLDNMNCKQMSEMVWIRNQYHLRTENRIPLEASGNMTLDRVKSVAATGVDYISVGELTHSVKAFDISLHINFKK